MKTRARAPTKKPGLVFWAIVYRDDPDTLCPMWLAHTRAEAWEIAKGWYQPHAWQTAKAKLVARKMRPEWLA